MKFSLARVWSRTAALAAGSLMAVGCGLASSPWTDPGTASGASMSSSGGPGGLPASAGQGGASGSISGASGTSSTSGTSTASGATGSSSSSDASSAPPAGPPRPQLITSGPNAYWVTTGQVTTTSSATADLIIDAATTYQRWDGFGGAFNEMGWDALSVVSSQIPTAMKLLFDPNEGLNFIYGRIPLGASDFAMSWYTDDDTTNNTPDYTMSSFSIARDQQKLIPFIKAAMQVRSDIHFWASPWTLPSWMTTGESPNAVKSDAQTMQALALYYARFVEEYAKVGLNIENVSPQNEPGYAFAQWPGTLFTDFIKTYMGPTFGQRNLTAGVMAGTMSAPQDGTLAIAIAGDPEAMKYVKVFGMQWNSIPSVGAVAAMAGSAPVRQTEHRCGNYPPTIMAAPYWDFSNNDAAYNPNMAQNDHAYGEASWQLLRDWIVAGVNSYDAWNMVLDTAGKNVSGWPQNALLVVDRSAKTLTATPAYYAFRHFTQVLPGATRIGIRGSTDAGSNDALAFENPDGTLIAEVYNSDDSPETTTVGVGATGYAITIPAHGWATLRVSP